MDVLTLNRYASWYSDSGHLELIQYQMYNELEAYTIKFNKPILITEYGAGALAGLHSVRMQFFKFITVLVLNKYKIQYCRRYI